MQPQRTIAKIYVKVKLGEQKSDFEYWQTQPGKNRLETLEQIRSEYHAWKENIRPDFKGSFRLSGANREGNSRVNREPPLTTCAPTGTGGRNAMG